MPEDWSAAWTAGIGRRVREARLRQGLSTHDLAERTAELGYPMARASIGNLETRPRTKIYLQDVAVLAAALGVPPLELLYPLEPVVIRPAALGPDDEGAYATLRNDVVEVLPHQPEPAHRAAGWFTGGFGRSLEARIAAMAAVAKFVEREQLLTMLEDEAQTGQLHERAKAAGAPAPEEFLPVLRMEVYDLAVAAERACQAHDVVARKAGDHRAAVAPDDREHAQQYAAHPPDPYIADPDQRPDVRYVFGIGRRSASLNAGPDDRPHGRLARERTTPTAYYTSDGAPTGKTDADR